MSLDPELTPPDQDLMELAKFKPLSWEDLVEAFEAWLTKGGNNSRQFFLQRSLRYGSQPMPEDMASVTMRLRYLAGIHSWLGGQIPDLENFITEAARVMEDHLKAEHYDHQLEFSRWQGYSPAKQKALIKSEMAFIVRWRDAFQNLYDSVKKKLEIGQTLSANARGERGTTGH